jgi:hypothetical protein
MNQTPAIALHYIAAAMALVHAEYDHRSLDRSDRVPTPNPAEDAIEHTLCQIRTVHVFKIPPRTTAAGYRQAFRHLLGSVIRNGHPVNRCSQANLRDPARGCGRLRPELSERCVRCREGGIAPRTVAITLAILLTICFGPDVWAGRATGRRRCGRGASRS